MAAFTVGQRVGVADDGSLYKRCVGVVVRVVVDETHVSYWVKLESYGRRRVAFREKQLRSLAETDAATPEDAEGVTATQTMLNDGQAGSNTDASGDSKLVPELDELLAQQLESKGTRAITDLGLKPVTYNTLLRHGIRTLSDLVGKREGDLLALPGFGMVCLADLRHSIARAAADDALIVSDDSIHRLKLNVRTFNTLWRNHIRSISAIKALSEEQLLDLYGFGRGSLDDLLQKLKAYDQDASLAAKRLPDQGLPDDSIKGLHLQKRTFNILWRNRIRTVSALAATSEKRLLSMRGFGIACLNDVLEELKAMRAFPQATPQLQTPTIEMGPVLTDDLLTYSESLSAEVSEHDVHDITSAMPIVIDEEPAASFGRAARAWLEGLLQSKATGTKTNSRDIQILMERMGWADDEPETLESIGNRLGITRERVRQVEAKAIGRLKSHANEGQSLSHGLWRAIASILDDSCGVVSIAELGEGLQRTFGWVSRPSVSGMCNLVEFLPSPLSEQWVYDKDSKLMTCKDSRCVGCRRASEFLREAVARLGEMETSDAVETVSNFCRTQCATAHRSDFKLSGSFIKALVVSDENLKAMCIRKGRLLLPDRLDLYYGAKATAIEAIVKQEGKEMHFTEVAERLKELRPNDRRISTRYVYSALADSSNLLLWGRGAYIHADNVQMPSALLKTIEKRIADELEDSLPFVSVHGVFKTFEEECTKSGVPSEIALYSCLRRSTGNRLQFPHYPQIMLAKAGVERVPRSVMIEQYFQEAGGPVSYSDASDYFVKKIGLKSYQMDQALADCPSVVRIAHSTYVHIRYLKVDRKGMRQLLDELVEYALQEMSEAHHMSVTRIFKSNIVKCRAAGITSPQLLHTLLDAFQSDRIQVLRYPRVSTPGEDATAGRGVKTLVEQYIRDRREVCPWADVEKHFVEELGYNANVVWSVHNSENVCDYATGAVVHIYAVGWSPDKQRQLEMAATDAFDDCLKIGQPYGTIDQLLENDSLPGLDGSVLWTRALLGDLLVSRGNFLLLGNAGNAYVPKGNQRGIITLEDLVYEILDSEFDGASNLQEFTNMLVGCQIIVKRLTPLMLGNCERVTIRGDEIVLTKLLDHA